MPLKKKPLEKSGLKPTPPNRRWGLRHQIINGDLAESIKRSASDQLGDLVP